MYAISVIVIYEKFEYQGEFMFRMGLRLFVI